MTYEVFLHKKAQKNLEKFPDRERIREHLLKLKDFPQFGDLVRIDDAIYRMRIGNYRALFKVYEEEGIIVVAKIDVRGKVYKSL
jgi:mRNA interferase RelE/StbE